MKRDSFILYSEWWEQIKKLNDEQRGRLLTAIFAHSREEVMPEMDPAVDMCFAFIQPTLDENAAEYAKRCEANRINGAKGGRPPKTVKAAAAPDNPEKPMGYYGNPRKHDNEYDHDYDSTYEDDEAIDAEYIGRGRARDDLPLPPDPPDEVEQAYIYAEACVRAAYRDAFGRHPAAEEVRYLCRIAVLSGKIDLIGEAIRRAAQNGARTVGKYVARIIDEWRLQGIDTLAELEEYDALRAVADGEISRPDIDRDGALAQIRENREAKYSSVPMARASP